MQKRLALEEIYQLLIQAYGAQGWWPLTDLEQQRSIYNTADSVTEKNPADQLEIIIGAVLTQNTNWKNVVKALINLKQDQLISVEQLKRLELQVLAEKIKPAGYFNQKALKIKRLVSLPRLPETREEWLSQWGIGPETADSILLYAFNQLHFVIDTYTQRIFTRIHPEFTNLRHYVQWQTYFQANLPENLVLYNEFHALLVYLGKKFCSKTNPVCAECVLKAGCHYSAANQSL